MRTLEILEYRDLLTAVFPDDPFEDPIPWVFPDPFPTAEQSSTDGGMGKDSIDGGLLFEETKLGHSESRRSLTH